MTPKRLISALIFISLLSMNFFAFSAAKKDDSEFNMGEMIMHHVLDDYQYEVFHGLTIPLPIIIYTEEKERLSDQKYLYEIAGNLLKDGGIKAKIIKQYLPIINKYINVHLGKMNFNIFQQIGDSKRIHGVLLRWHTLPRNLQTYKQIDGLCVV